MRKYVINDVWMALKLSFNNFFTLMFFLAIILLSIYFLINSNYIHIDKFIIENYPYILGIIVLIVFIQSIIIYFANRRYIIDLDSGLITFPRSDIENSVIAILLLYPYWNLMRTITINAIDIENVYLDTKRWSTKHQVSNGATTDGAIKYKTETKNHILYTINLTGAFGSANLQFLSRQKRDEVRNAIQQSVKLHNGRNIDRKVAELI